MEKQLTPEETEAQRTHERVNRAIFGLGRKTRRATIHDVRGGPGGLRVVIDQPLRRVSPLTGRQARHLRWARKERDK